MQKFQTGDHVRVVKELHSSMSHFQKDCEAIVEYSYEDMYGGGSERHGYSIYIKGYGGTAWCPENTLILIEKGRHDLLQQWKDEKEQEARLKGDKAG